MQQSKVDIKIGESTFSITTPFTLGQLRVFQPAFKRSKGLFEVPEQYDDTMLMIETALSVDYPDIDRKAISQLRVTPIELRDACDELLIASGMFTRAQFDEFARSAKAKEEKKQGEAEASTGATSTVS